MRNHAFRRCSSLIQCINISTWNCTPGPGAVQVWLAPLGLISIPLTASVTPAMEVKAKLKVKNSLRSQCNYILSLIA